MTTTDVQEMSPKEQRSQKRFLLNSINVSKSIKRNRFGLKIKIIKHEILKSVYA